MAILYEYKKGEFILRELKEYQEEAYLKGLCSYYGVAREKDLGERLKDQLLGSLGYGR